MNDVTGNPGNRVAVWDLPIRLFHWTLLIAVTVSFVSIELFDNIDVHVQSGQVVLGLLVFRLLWGIVGSSTAQFHKFVRGPRAVLGALKGEAQTRTGHNALGALSVLALLASLSIQVLTGLGSDDEIFTTGPLNQYLSASQVSWANSIHEVNSKVLLALIALHVAAIAWYALVKKRNLVWPMIVGWTQALPGHFRSAESVRFRSIWLALLVAGVGLLAAWSVFRL